MRRLFRLTRGRFNDACARLEHLAHPPRRFSSSTGVLGDLPPRSANQIAGVLRRDGLCRFETRLSPDVCRRLRRFAEQAPRLVLFYPKRLYVHPRDRDGLSDGLLFQPASRFRDVYLWRLGRSG